MIPHPVSAPVESAPVRPSQKTTSTEATASSDKAFQDAYDNTDAERASANGAEDTPAEGGETSPEGRDPSAASDAPDEAETNEETAEGDAAEIAVPLVDVAPVHGAVKAETFVAPPVTSETEMAAEPLVGARTVKETASDLPAQQQGQAGTGGTNAKGAAVATTPTSVSPDELQSAAPDAEGDIAPQTTGDKPRVVSATVPEAASKAAASAVVPAQSLIKQVQGLNEEPGGDIDLAEEMVSETAIKGAEAPSGTTSSTTVEAAKPMVQWVSPAEVSVAMRAVQDDGEFRLGGQEAAPDDAEAQLQLVVSNTTGPSATSVLAGTTRAEGALISGQIAASVQRNGPGQFELALNPPELGRLKITLESRDSGIVVSISADRPETMDLIRRHVDQLERDFLEMGYQDATFNFGEQDGANGEGDGATGGSVLSDVVEAEVSNAPSAPAPDLMSTGHIDIRV